ncbi:MAG TPA: hypothetical protein VHW65_05230 [Gemmatimonadales bacterium]|jgi:hypothetical protein|nr:hypothetical protein [Gemmatimonadales bacterium]
MRWSSLLALPLYAGLIAVSACGPGYTNGGVDVGVGANLGPGVDVWSYSSDDFGDWHANYRSWAPTTVYELNGTYYNHNIHGSRAVQVYHNSTGYFMPPHDQSWAGTDKRFKTNRTPTEADYGRARPRPHP